MDIMLYFMKLEDKYWGLFLAALFLLYIFLFVQKKENGRWLVLYGFLTYLVFACPLAYRLFADYGGMEKTYYKVSHIELVYAGRQQDACAGLLPGAGKRSV